MKNTTIKYFNLCECNFVHLLGFLKGTVLGELLCHCNIFCGAICHIFCGAIVTLAAGLFITFAAELFGTFAAELFVTFAAGLYVTFAAELLSHIGCGAVVGSTMRRGRGRP